jgi:hypothetical protein
MVVNAEATAGLRPSSIGEGFVKGVPIGIHRLDQSEFPIPPPSFAFVFAKARIHEPFIGFVINEPCHAIPAREPGANKSLMLENPARQFDR